MTTIVLLHIWLLIGVYQLSAVVELVGSDSQMPSDIHRDTRSTSRVRNDNRYSDEPAGGWNAPPHSAPTLQDNNPRSKSLHPVIRARHSLIQFEDSYHRFGLRLVHCLVESTSGPRNDHQHINLLYGLVRCPRIDVSTTVRRQSWNTTESPCSAWNRPSFLLKVEGLSMLFIGCLIRLMHSRHEKIKRWQQYEQYEHDGSEPYL